MSLFKKNDREEKNLTDELLEKETAEAAETAPVEAKKKAKAGKKFSFKNNRKLRIGATATAVTAVVTAAVILLNVVVGLINDRFPLSWDLTTDGSFTLSDESREVAETITKEVTITMFAKKGLFENSTDTLQRQFHEFTNAYATLSGGKVKTVYVDLDANPELKAAYADYNVSGEGNVLFQCGEQWRTIAWSDMYEENYDNYYTTGTVETTSLIEQKLASNINAVSGDKIVYLTFLTGHGEDEDYITYMKNVYELNGYMTETVNFSTSAQIHKNAGALFIVAPEKDYTEDEIVRLREWMRNNGERGRNLFVFCNPKAAGSCTNLYEFLETDYEITVTDNLIVETDSSNLLSNSGESYVLSTVQSTDLTAEIADDDKVVMPETLQLITNGRTETSEYALTNHAVVTFAETARLRKSGDVGEALKADNYPITGVAYAYDYEYKGTDRKENYVFVSGSYLTVAFSQYSQFGNHDLLVEPVRKVCSLGDTVVISGHRLTTESVTFTAMTTTIVGRGIFSYGIPLILIIIAIVIFIKRRHL